MAYFSTRDVIAIAMCAALWAVLGITIGPIFWRLTHMPFLCDMTGVVLLILALWWTRRLGAVTLTGFVATILTLTLMPGATHFFGFMAASVVFDAFARLIGYRNCLDRPILSAISLLFISVVSTAVAGLIIGRFFMNPMGGLAFFAGLHALGGFIGGVIGFTVVRALMVRGVTPSRL